MTQKLHLYEELMLLILHDKKGTPNISFVEQAVSGAIIAELLLDGRISIAPTKKQQIQIESRDSCNDPIIDDCLRQISDSKKLRSLSDWIGTLSRQKNLRHNIARQLCQRGILRGDEGKVLLLFSRRIYPEVNPAPEQEIIARIETALNEDSLAAIDPQTAVLISIAEGTELLKFAIGKDKVKQHKNRITEIASRDAIGKATKDVIATIVAVMAAVSTTSTIATS